MGQGCAAISKLEAGRAQARRSACWLMVLAFSVLLNQSACGEGSAPIAPAKSASPVHDSAEESLLVARPGQSETFWRRHAEINSLPQRDEIELVFLGDSITQRWEDDGR